MENPQISVIVPVYNVERYLEKCVRSVLNQTFADFELILIDDGSTDGSTALCDRLENIDSRIRVIHQENRGLAAARNRGIEASRGQYLIFLDSDDYWSGNVLDELLKTLRETGAEMVLFPLQYEDENEKTLPTPAFPSPGIYGPEEMLNRLCSDGTPQLVTAVNRLTCRFLWNNLRFPAGRVHEDEYTAHYLYGGCRHIAVTDQTSYHYLQRSGSITRQESAGRRLDGIDAFLDRAVFLRETGREQALIPTIRSAMHWYLTLLGASSPEKLKESARWPEVLLRLREVLKPHKALFGTKDWLAVRHPFLWQRLHRLNHRN